MKSSEKYWFLNLLPVSDNVEQHPLNSTKSRSFRIHCRLVHFLHNENLFLRPVNNYEDSEYVCEVKYGPTHTLYQNLELLDR